MVKKLQESAGNRQELIDMCDKLYSKADDLGLGEAAEEILDNHNAAENDSLYPDEGFFGSMSNEDLTRAIQDLVDLIDNAKKIVSVAFDLQVPKDMTEDRVQRMIIGALSGHDIEVSGFMEIHTVLD